MNRISICLSDLPKEKMKQAQNGKIYINLVTAERREHDQYGNDVTVYVDQTKEEREARKDRIYVGSGKSFTFNPSTPENVEQLPTADNNNVLPWDSDGNV